MTVISSPGILLCPRSNFVEDVPSSVQIVVRVVLKYTYIGSGGSRYPDDRRGGGPLGYGGGYERERGGPPGGELNVHPQTLVHPQTSGASQKTRHRKCVQILNALRQMPDHDSQSRNIDAI